MIEVKARNKTTGQEQILTYSAYKDVAYLFDLIGQIDSKGNLIDGDPNLLPQHKRRSANVIVADAGQREQTGPVFDPSNIPPALREQFEAKKAEMEAKKPFRTPARTFPESRKSFRA